MSKTNITAFDAAEYLDSEETIAAYLNDALESGNEDVVLAAFRDVAKARGMARIAADAGVQRESLYKSLSEGAKPRFETMLKVASALGVRFVMQASQTHQAMRRKAQAESGRAWRDGLPETQKSPLGKSDTKAGTKRTTKTGK
jgi:probable addiction module antidote protein